MMSLTEKMLLLKKARQHFLRRSRVFSLAMLCCLIVFPPASYAGREAIKHGAVMTRTMILDDEGRPILVEYDAQGAEGSNISDKLSPEQKANMDQLVIMSLAEYKLEKKRYEDFKLSRANDLALDAELMSKEKFEQMDFKAADGKTTIVKPTLKPFVKGVLVRGQSNRVVPLNHNGPWEPLVLLSFGLDLSQKEPTISSGTLLVDSKGQIIHQTENNIAPRVGFFGDPNEKQEFYTGIRKNDDEIFGPVKDVKVYIEPDLFLGSLAATDYRGKYTMRFLMPYCPGGFEYTTDLWAELRYANFGPFGAPAIPYYLRRQDWTYCYEPFPYAGGTLVGAMAYVNALAISATMAIPLYNADFKVDVMFLSGKVLLKNPDGTEITVGTTTEYNLDAPETSKEAQAYYDFDGDGKQDKSEIGIIENQVQEDGTIKKVFKKTGNGEYQAVYFSSHVKPDGSPDVIRIADVKKKLKPNGLLKSISKDDLKDTDILVFRESTGQLVLERRGLRDKEIASRIDHGLGKDEKYFYYRLMMRGPSDTVLNVGAINRRVNWEDWATEYKLEEPFQKREADHLKSGEWIRLVIINRATGYMATQRILLGDASINKNNMLNVKLEDTYLMPPNLKIWAERNYKHEYGLDKGKEEKNSVIGTEGASTTDDESITVFTEWYDEEGRPLPEGLGAGNGENFGLTARLARVTAENKIGKASDAGNLAEFAIRPGSYMEVLRKKDNMTNADHFYVHVVGKQKIEKPDFETPGIQEVLDTRPKNATPFLVPFNDESEDWKSWSAWNQLKRAYEAEQLAEEPTKPRAHYTWYHRPEYQFSQISLEVESIVREYTDEAGNTNEQELLFEQEGEGKVPTIRGDDDLVTLFYSLIANNYNRLSPLDGEQEFIFGLGANEIKATIGKNGEIRFDNLEHIDYLDPTDLLSIRLYLNHDAANTLWEWAFTRNGLHVYYQVPGNTETRDKKVQNDIEILSLMEKDENKTETAEADAKPDAKVEVRTLGGMRLRYQYKQPSLKGIEVTKVTWTIAKKGAYCLDYGIGLDHCPESRDKGSGEEFELKSPQTDWSVYWEPRNDQGKPDWTNWAAEDDGVKATLKAEYTLPVIDPKTQQEKRVTEFYEKEFYIKTRELKPIAKPEKPMEGSDVQILEAMLWAFGVSPQRGADNKTKSNAGSEGNRIYSKRKTGMTENCDGSDAKVRNIYSGGWEACPNGYVALEAMVRRFQGRNIATCDDNEDSCTNNYAGRTSATNGVVDPATLTMLERIWKEFYSAYVSQKSRSIINEPELSWSNAAIGIWDRVDSGFVETYSDAKHNAMLGTTNNKATGSRGDLLDAWIRQESANKFWGQGFPATGYRVFEGGGDEFASLGYNQIKYAYRYGAQGFQDKCPQLKDYNMYKPDDNIKGMVAFTTAIGCGSGGGFKRAFSEGGRWTKMKSNNADLKGYKLAGEDTFHAMNKDRVDDAYELLAKAIGSYNGGTGMNDYTWANMLKATNPGLEDGKPKMGKGNSNKTYALQVLRRFGAPARTYIWKGGIEPAEIPVLGSDGKPEKNEDGTAKMQTNPKAGQDWCFAYGEQEWMSGKDWEDELDKATGSAATNKKPAVTPIGRINCE